MASTESSLQLRGSSALRLAALTTTAMIAFAANSVLCRLALKNTAIDPATFTSIRLISGATMLGLITLLHQRALPRQGNWISAGALFAYAAAFSFAYIGLPAGTGALLLFTAVQSTMITHALARGERLRPWQWIGFLLSLSGLIALLAPGLAAPPPTSAALMLAAGIAWGIYSIRGRSLANPAGETAGNFVRSMPLTLALSAALFEHHSFDRAGALYAVLSGAIASGLGYAIWYSALRDLRAASAAAVQLSVPAIAAVGGVIFLGEAITLRLFVASAAILGGIGLVVANRRPG